jgi:hypothetical protein
MVSDTKPLNCAYTRPSIENNGYNFDRETWIFMPTCLVQWTGSDQLIHVCFNKHKYKGDHVCPCGEKLRQHKPKKLKTRKGIQYDELPPRGQD